MSLIHRNKKTEDQPETEDQYVTRMLAEEKTEHYRNQYRHNQLLKKQADAQAAADAPAIAERERRFEQMVLKEARKKENSDTETCPVCGLANIPKCAVSHPIYGTDDKCFRKPKEARYCGQLNTDQWDMLTGPEKNNGFILRGGEMLGNAARLASVTKEVAPGTPNPLLHQL
jgi:hypothetical protein